MCISWDENQLPALCAWIEDKLPLSQGELVIESLDFDAGDPNKCFAGHVDITGKEVIVYTNFEMSMSAISVNVFLGYILARAYDKTSWNKFPSYDLLAESHREVCRTLLDFNEAFSKALEEQFSTLERWHETYVDDQGGDEGGVDTLIDQMGSSLFSMNPVDSKNYGIN